MTYKPIVSCPKSVNVNDDTRTAKDSHTLMLPTIQRSPVTSARALLEEEKTTGNLVDLDSRAICYVCSTTIERGTVVCETCNALCHSNCAKENSDKTTYTCIPCDGIINQLAQISDDANVNRHKNAYSCIPHDVTISQSTQASNDVLIVKSNADTQKEKDKVKDNLKEKEQKLKRWENKLKVKEKELTENAKQRCKMETYIKKIENDNHELTLTLQTLNSRIEQLETQLQSKKTECNVGKESKNPVITEQADCLVTFNKIQNKVTDFILRQVDVQIDLLTAKANSLDEKIPSTSIVCAETQQPNKEVNAREVYHLIAPQSGTHHDTVSHKDQGPSTDCAKIIDAPKEIERSKLWDAPHQHLLSKEYVAVPRNRVQDALAGQPLYQKPKNKCQQQMVPPKRNKILKSQSNQRVSNQGKPGNRQDKDIVVDRTVKDNAVDNSSTQSFLYQDLPEIDLK